MNLRQALIDALFSVPRTEDISAVCARMAYQLRDHGTLFGVEIPDQVPDAEPLRELMEKYNKGELAYYYNNFCFPPIRIGVDAKPFISAICSALGEKE